MNRSSNAYDGVVQSFMRVTKVNDGEYRAEVPATGQHAIGVSEASAILQLKHVLAEQQTHE